MSTCHEIDVYPYQEHLGHRGIGPGSNMAQESGGFNPYLNITNSYHINCRDYLKLEAYTNNVFVQLKCNGSNELKI